MPIFEYSCHGCDNQFEMLVRTNDIPECPKCKSQQLTRLLSVPALKSETTHALAMKAAKARDKKQGEENTRAQREYELHHND